MKLIGHETTNDAPPRTKAGGDTSHRVIQMYRAAQHCAIDFFSPLLLPSVIPSPVIFDSLCTPLPCR